jgi:hypothetical protein
MVTVTGNFESLTGAGTGYVIATLINFGNNVPRVSGTGLIVNPSSSTGLSSNFSLSLWGNDVITPSNTYYQISFYGTNKLLIAADVYQFTSGGTYDLSATSPVVVTATTPLGLATVAYSGSYTDLSNAPSMTPALASGTVNGSNATFTFTAAATPTPQLLVFVAGVFQYPGAGHDYTVAYSGSNTWTITFATAPPYGPIAVIPFIS